MRIIMFALDSSLMNGRHVCFSPAFGFLAEYFRLFFHIPSSLGLPLFYIYYFNVRNLIRSCNPPSL